MHRLLIADSDDVFLTAAMQAFSADFEVYSCQDGETALEMLSELQPQVLILNLFLPFKDGITVLQQTSWVPPVTIATTVNMLPHIEQTCLELKVGFLMVSPCLNALRVRTVHMVNQWEQNQSPADPRAQAVLHLHILNFPTHRIGYRQLCEAIPMYYRDRDICLEIVLYAQIAEMFQKTNSGTVERSMRAVIEQAWEQRDPLVWKKYFPNQRTCPSNKVFFDAIADHLSE